MKVPSVGVLGGQDSGLEILLGEGGDVELGAQTSEHIFVFAFNPLPLNPLSLYIVQSIIHIIISYLFVLSIIHIAISFILVLCLVLFHIAHSYMLGLLVCVPHLYLTTRASYSTSTHI